MSQGCAALMVCVLQFQKNVSYELKTVLQWRVNGQIFLETTVYLEGIFDWPNLSICASLPAERLHSGSSITP